MSHRRRNKVKMFEVYAHNRNRQREITFSVSMMGSIFHTVLTIEDVHDMMEIIHNANQRAIQASVDTPPPAGAYPQDADGEMPVLHGRGRDRPANRNSRSLLSVSRGK